jgi:hypothetical protein
MRYGPSGTRDQSEICAGVEQWARYVHLEN